MDRLAGFKIAGLAFVLIVALVAGSYGQPMAPRDRDRQVREAKDLAKVGQLDAAARKLERLYSVLPDDGVVVSALFKILVDGEQYGRAEEIMKRYIDRKPGDVKARADLAGLYLTTGRDDEGMALLGWIVERAPAEAWPYEISLHVLLDNERADEVIGFISRAREGLSDSTIFAEDAARIHKAASRYRRATREYLLAGAVAGANFETTGLVISAMASDEAARGEVIAALENARGIEAFKKSIDWVLWQVYLLDGDCGKALDELARAAPGNRALSEMLTVLARRALEAGCYTECGRAYALAAKYAKDESRIPSLLLEGARCEMAGGLIEQALATYREVLDEYAGSAWAAEASYARGRIYRDLGRLEDAVAEADLAISLVGPETGGHGAVLFKGECLVEMGKLDEAFETYDLVQTDWEREYAQEAFFNLGEISLFKAGFEEAAAYYNVTLREYADEPRANDAIDRLMLLKASKVGEGYRGDIKELARAILLKRQGKVAEAETLLTRLATGREAIKVESLKYLSEMYLEQGAFDAAIQTYKIIGDSLNVHFSPAALEAVGDIYTGLGRTEEAIGAYEDVILKFPDSVSAGEARRKIELARRGSGEDS
jgi:tetratricopeptide (TPR) repeat protein